MENTISIYLARPAEEPRRRRRRGRIAAAMLVGVMAAAAMPKARNDAPRIGVQAMAPIRVVRHAQPVGPPVPVQDEPKPEPPPPSPAKAVVMPSRLDFSERGGTQLATIRNDGGLPIERVSVSADAPFLATNGCARGVAPGAECVVAVVFSPRKGGSFTGTLNVAAGGERSRIALRGILTETAPPMPVPVRVPAPVPAPAPPPVRLLCFDPPSIHFTTPGTQTITLTNPEPTPLRVASIEALGRRGDTASGYSVEASRCLRFLGAGQQCTFTITATERALKTKEIMNLRVEYEDPATGQRQAARASAACRRR
ncbi:MAG TPA: choice-of-anchor D domain-containing protein [Thermoanaerobaculia bacterium]|nr:choice-of-anchor D domain-containing protein [Thermoanaerobaculia bacterium]